MLWCERRETFAITGDSTIILSNQKYSFEVTRTKSNLPVWHTGLGITRFYWCRSKTSGSRRLIFHSNAVSSMLNAPNFPVWCSQHTVQSQTNPNTAAKPKLISSKHFPIQKLCLVLPWAQKAKWCWLLCPTRHKTLNLSQLEHETLCASAHIDFWIESLWAASKVGSIFAMMWAFASTLMHWIPSFCNEHGIWQFKYNEFLLLILLMFESLADIFKGELNEKLFFY